MSLQSKNKTSFTGPRRASKPSGGQRTPILPRRLLAFQLDTALSHALAFKILHAEGTDAAKVIFFFGKLIEGTSQLVAWRVLIVVLAVMPLFYVVCLTTVGYTPGMWVAGLRLQAGGRRPASLPIKAAVLRCYTVAWAWIFYFIPLLYGLRQAGLRHLGDMMSGTQMVRHTAPRRKSPPPAPKPVAVGLATLLMLIVASLWFMSAGRVLIAISPVREGVVFGEDTSERRAYITHYRQQLAADKLLRKTGHCDEPEACFKYFKELLGDKNKDMLVLITSSASQSLIDIIGKTRYVNELPSSDIVFIGVEPMDDPNKVKVYYKKPDSITFDKSLSGLPSDDQKDKTEYLLFAKERDVWRIDWVAYFIEQGKINLPQGR